MTAPEKPRYDEGTLAHAVRHLMSRRLLCIGLGVDDYDDPSLAQLRFAALDVLRLHEALALRAASEGDMLLLLPDTDAVVAVDKIRAFLRDNKVRQGDRVLFIFAGHGMLVSDAGQVERQYLLLRRADTRALVDGHVAGNDVLAVHSLLALFDGFHATFALLIDACRLPAQRVAVPFAGQTRDAIRVGLVGRALPGLRPSVPGRYRPPLPVQGIPAAAPEASESPGEDPRHLLVYSSEAFDQAHEVESLGGGLFLSTFTAWLKDRLEADELAVIDQDWVGMMADRMGAAARTVQVSIPQRPWISHADRVFALHRPADTAGRPPPPHPPKPPVARPAVPVAVAKAGSPAAPASPTAPRAPAAVAAERWRQPWFRFQLVSEAWCPAFIHLSPALTGLPHGLAITEDPVTWMQWWAIMERRPREMPATEPRSPGDCMPVTWVSREECEEFAQKLSTRLSALGLLAARSPLRLMSDQEWTLACAGGASPQSGRFPQAVQVEDAVFRWSALNRPRKNNPAAPQHVAHPHHRPNAWGLRGMHGNVRELAWHHLVPGRTVAMGGGFRSEPQELRPEHSIAFTMPGDDIGFRLVRVLQPGEAANLQRELQA